MDFLQDCLFGKKSAISSQLLSLNLKIPLKESEQLLTEFLENNRDALDAAYKVSANSSQRTIVRIVGAQQAAEHKDSARIYILSSQGATDPAVIADVGQRARLLQLQSKQAELSKCGFCVNPLLDPEFVVDSKSRIFGPLAAAMGTKTVGAAPKPAPLPKPVASAAPPTQKPAVTRPAVSTTNRNDSAADKKPDAKKKTNSTPSASSGVKNPFPFAKTEKSQALKSARKSQHLPINEKVVMAEDAHDDEGEIDDETKERQMKSLASLYDTDPVKPERRESRDEDIDMEADEDDDEAQLEEPGNIDDMEMDMEPINVPKVELKKTEPKPESKTPEPSGANSKKRTRRVQKLVEHEDEEGFTVTETQWVDAEISDDSEEPEATNRKPSAKDQEEEPKAEPKSSLEKKAKTENTGRKAAAPPTIRKNNQRDKSQPTLMSFFK